MLFSLHLKATMMKVSDPIMFGHAVRLLQDVLAKHADTLKKLGVNLNNGFGDLLSKIATLPDAERAAIEADIKAEYAKQPGLAMVNSDKGITNLRAVRRDRRRLHAGDDPRLGPDVERRRQAAGREGDDPRSLLRDHVPGRHRRLQKNGAFDPKTMGSVPNVGLMAQKAEEYGSHDKTFEVPTAGRRCASSRRWQRFCWSARSKPATSSAPAPSRTPRSATGSASPCARAPSNTPDRLLARQGPRA